MLPIGTLAGLLLIGLLASERCESLKGRLLFKPLVSLLFVTAALCQAPFQSAYGAWILGGLVLSLVGDILLAVPRQSAFVAGIGVFMLAHVMYIAAFAAVCPPAAWLWWGVAVVAAAGIGIYARLYPRLGALKWPVAAYVTVISLMLLGAVGIWRWSALPPAGRRAVVLGALLFYLSDLFVARNRFVKNQFLNRLAGLPLYYTGQFLLALSIGLIPGKGL